METNFYCIEISEFEPIHTIRIDRDVADYLNILKIVGSIIIEDYLYKYLFSEFRIKECDFSENVLDIFITQRL